MTIELSREDLAAFEAVAHTILPPLASTGPGWEDTLTTGVIRHRLPLLFASLPHDATRIDLRRMLGLLRNPGGGLVLFGRPRAFTSLNSSDRPAAYRAMESNPVGLVRNGARALKTLVAYLWVTQDSNGAVPPSWTVMGYPGPTGPPPDSPKTLRLETVSGDTTLTADVVVVGSGAGGGVAAAVLAAAGLDVVALDAGAYRNEGDYTHLEADAYRDMYLHGGLTLTADGGTALLAGATLGGGSVINYTTSFPTPFAIRQDWDLEAGFEQVFTGAEFESSTATVGKRFGVNRDNGWPSTREQILEKGLRHLGWHVDEQPRNAVRCETAECGYCTMGCRIGAKQSTLRTFLVDATEAGARLIAGASVDRVTTENGIASGVVAKVGSHTVTIKARAVVLAAGALNTPAILLRSKIGGPACGRYLRLHPVTVVWGRFRDRVDPWTGILQARYSDQFADLDGHGYGFKFETAPVHPLFPAAFLGWEDGLSFKRDVLGLGHTGLAGILLRDRDQGRVSIRRDGSPVWKYSISSYDQKHIREGVLRGAQVMEAAGAEEIISSTIRPVRWRPGSDGIHRFIAAIDRIGYGSNQMAYFSFHQMGSARMGSNPATSVVGADNQAHDTPGVYVMDGSCFPTSSGVNPMISIAAIAHRGATHLAATLA